MLVEQILYACKGHLHRVVFRGVGWREQEVEAFASDHVADACGAVDGCVVEQQRGASLEWEGLNEISECLAAGGLVADDVMVNGHQQVVTMPVFARHQHSNSGTTAGGITVDGPAALVKPAFVQRHQRTISKRRLEGSQKTAGSCLGARTAATNSSALESIPQTSDDAMGELPGDGETPAIANEVYDFNGREAGLGSEKR